MFGKYLSLALLSSALLACAEPKYINSDSKLDGNQNQKSSTACNLRFQNADLCLSWTWETYPTETKAGAFIFRTFKLNSLDQFPVLTDALQTPQVLLWMPSMGHGSTPVTVSRLETGTYRASQVFFIMAGEWEIKFQLKDSDTVLDEVSDALSF